MMVKTSSGVMLHGEIAKPPEFRNAGQKQILSFSLKVHSVKNEAGKWESLFVQVDIWSDLDAWDGMLFKGDQVTVYAPKLKEREYNGKTYYSVDAVDIQPGGLVTFRWMQQIVDMIPPAAPAAQPELAETTESTPFDPPDPPEETPVQTSLTGGELYPGERLSDYAPDRSPAPESVPSSAGDALIDDDADDLPF